MTTLPDWLWIAAFLGCFLFGGICATVLLFTLFGREEHAPEPHCAPPPRPQADTLPEVWPPDDIEITRTQISRTC